MTSCSKNFWLSPLARAAALGLAVFVLGAVRGFAHDPGFSTAVVRIGPAGVDAEMVFSITDAAELVNLDRDGDGKYSKDELTGGLMELQTMVNQALETKVDGKPVLPSTALCRFDEQSNATVNLVFPATNISSLTLCSSWLVLLQPGHRESFIVENDAHEKLTERMLSANDHCVTLQINPAQAMDASLSNSVPAAPPTSAAPAGSQRPGWGRRFLKIQIICVGFVALAGCIWLVSRRR